MSDHASKAALERIAIVCSDNMDRSCDHRMALDFVRQIANNCLSRCDVLSESERHAAHARHQVACSNPENPDCTFDYELIRDLLCVIDRAADLRAQLHRAQSPVGWGNDVEENFEAPGGTP